MQRAQLPGRVADERGQTLQRRRFVDGFGGEHRPILPDPPAGNSTRARGVYLDTRRPDAVNGFAVFSSEIDMLRRTLIALVLLAAPARAEVIQLLDNTQLSGKIVHFYDGVFAIETSGGQKIDVPIAKIKQITFKLPPPRPEFSTPEKTFLRYKEALLKNDMQKVIDCYALMYQGMLASQIGQAGDELAKMQKEVQGMKFEIKGSKISGSNATLKVQRSKGEDVETAEVHLVLENGEWKMTP
jgi:hypothetical protein